MSKTISCVEAEVKMTGSTLVRNLEIKKRFTLYCFFENIMHFYFIMFQFISLVNIKNNYPLRFAAIVSQSISATIHLQFGGLIVVNY